MKQRMRFELSNIVAVILAGGYGTRVQHLLPNIPKPMAPVARKPFIEWILLDLKQQGITQALLSTGYLAAVIEEHFQSQPVEGLQISCCRENSPLGTAGGFLQAVTQIENKPEAWLVMNGDSLICANLWNLAKYLTDNSVDGVILGSRVADTSRYGSLIYDKQNNLLSFAEKQQGSGVINAGVYLLRQSLLEKFPNQVPLSFEQEVFPTLLARDVRLKVHIVEAPFLDIGTPESLAQAEIFIEQNYQKLIR